MEFRRVLFRSGMSIGNLRVDGGMSANSVFTQVLADATQRQIELSPVTEATTLGAAFLAGMAVSVWKDTEDVARAWSPRATVDPARVTDRSRWYAARDRALAWVPELSSLDF